MSEYIGNPLKDKRRNMLCICHSGKKFKNCHLDIYEKAERNIMINTNRIREIIRLQAKLIKDDYKLNEDKYNVTVIKDSRSNIYTYSVNNYPVIKVDYKDLPMDILTIKKAERISELKFEEIEIEIIYKSKTKEKTNGIES